jgi:hypothetical protein
VWAFRPGPADVKTPREEGGPSFIGILLGSQQVPGVEESGFSMQEFGRDQPFRWTDGNARLVIPLRKGEPPPKGLLVRLRVHRLGAKKGAHVRIVANGRELFSGAIPRDASEKTLDLAGVEMGQEVAVQIESDTFVPAGSLEGDGRVSTDERTLGVQVLGVLLLPESLKPPIPGKE